MKLPRRQFLHLAAGAAALPAVSRIATDLALGKRTRVVERVEDFRMDRFDEDGNPPFVDPVALPFPVRVDD